MLTGQITDWRECRNSCMVQPSRWKSLLFAMGLSPSPPSYKTSTMRGNFYFVLEELAGFAGTPHWNSVIVQALGEAAGAFASAYYNWCEARGDVSGGMQQLDRALSSGV